MWYEADTATVLDSSSVLSILPSATTTYVIKGKGELLSYASVLAEVDSSSSYILAVNDTVSSPATNNVLFNVLANDSLNLFLDQHYSEHNKVLFIIKIMAFRF